MHLTFRRKTWQTPQRFDQEPPKQAEEARQAARSQRHDECLQELGEGAQNPRTWPGVSSESCKTLSEDTNWVRRWVRVDDSQGDEPRRLTAGETVAAAASERDWSLDRTDAHLNQSLKHN